MSIEVMLMHISDGCKDAYKFEIKRKDGGYDVVQCPGCDWRNVNDKGIIQLKEHLEPYLDSQESLNAHFAAAVVGRGV